MEISVNAGQACATYKRGDVLLSTFPNLSDPTGDLMKRRPALVIALLSLQTVLATFDYLICMITSQNPPDPLLLPIHRSQITSGLLTADQSCLRPCYLYGASESIIIRKIATLDIRLADEVARRITALIGASLGDKGNTP